MRIISGIYKSRKIKSPSGKKKIRPSTDSTRETVFNILTNLITFDEFYCADLFCGTGSYGLECLSRGAKQCYFIDTNTKLVNENISLLNLENSSIVKRGDGLNFLKKFQNKKDKFIIFADPPYEYKNYEKLIEYTSNLNCLFILEHNSNFDAQNFKIKPFIQKRLGISRISIYNFLKEIKTI